MFPAKDGIDSLRVCTDLSVLSRLRNTNYSNISIMVPATIFYEVRPRKGKVQTLLRIKDFFRQKNSFIADHWDNCRHRETSPSATTTEIIDLSHTRLIRKAARGRNDFWLAPFNYGIPQEERDWLQRCHQFAQGFNELRPQIALAINNASNDFREHFSSIICDIDAIKPFAESANPRYAEKAWLDSMREVPDKTANGFFFRTMAAYLYYNIDQKIHMNDFYDAQYIFCAKYCSVFITADKKQYHLARLLCPSTQSHLVRPETVNLEVPHLLNNPVTLPTHPPPPPAFPRPRPRPPAAPPAAASRPAPSAPRPPAS